MLTNLELNTIESVDAYIYEIMNCDTSGHDYYHVKRVVNLTSRLISCENEFVALMIAYLHDVYDDKINPVQNVEASIISLLDDKSFNCFGNNLEIARGVSQIGFKGGFGVKSKSLEAAVVSDADLLDSMGAIGIARTFYYAGSKSSPLYDPTLENIRIDSYSDYRNKKRNAISHFDEKLLKLQDYIVTEKGQEIAIERHRVLVDFYNQFYKEVADL